MRDALWFVGGLFVAFLPPRYRTWWPNAEHDSFTRVILVSAIIQLLGAILLFAARLIAFGQGDSETAQMLMRAADAQPVQQRSNTEVPVVTLPTTAVGGLMMVEFMFSPLNMFLFYMFFEGMVRAVAAVVAGEKLGTIPLYLVSGVHGLVHRAKFKHDLGPLVADEVVRGTPKSDYDLKVYSCRPKLHWNPYVTIEFEDQFYQMFREEPGNSPRRFIYYLRKNPVGRVVVKIHHYEADELLKTRK